MKYGQRREYDFYSHQPYLETNAHYMKFRPYATDPLKGIIWEAYQVERFDSKKEIAFPDICADIMTLYTDDGAYSYFMGGTDTSRSMRDIDFIDDVNTIFGIKFCPGAIGNIFKEEVHDAAGSQIEAQLIMYNGKSVVDQLSYAHSFDDKLKVLGNYLIGRLQDGYEFDLLSSYVTDRIMQTHGLVRMGELAEETGYTDRYLRKVMKQRLGMRMKTFSQIVQMQWSYHLQNEGYQDKINLADLAQICGYYDQSHMNANYKKLTGMLPTEAFQLYQ